ncbi:MAG: polysaccharide deacetylase family protein [Pseudomonadota bacterium]
MRSPLQPSSQPPWPVPRFIQASVAWHAAAAGWAMVQPGMWPWALAGVAVNHLGITAAGLWPRSQWLGPNITRLGAAATAQGALALTIDDGPDPEVTPWVLDALEAHGIRATFFCIAERARRHPRCVQQIVERGHSVQNHSYSHPHSFSLRGPRGLRQEIRAAQAVLTELSGQQPTCFRAPAGLRNPFLDPVLHREGLQLVSWTRRGFDTRERSPQKVADRLTIRLAAGDILLVHDGHAARDLQGRPVILGVLPLLAERARAQGLHWATLPAVLADPPTEQMA